MKTIGREFLEATTGGLEIIRKYLSTSFELGSIVQSETNPVLSFKVVWSDRYNNYVIYIFHNDDEIERFNAIWFVKWQFDLTEQAVYDMLDDELQLGIINPVKPKQEKKRLNF